MANTPLIHLVMGNVRATGKTQFAALLADYFRHHEEAVRCVDVSSQGYGLSGYPTLRAHHVSWPTDLVTGEAKELKKIFSFSPEVRVVDVASPDFDVVIDFLGDHRLGGFPGWVIHFPVTPKTLKEAREGLLKLLPFMPFPLVFWLNGFHGNEAIQTVLSTLTMAKRDVAGWVVISERHAMLSLGKEKSVLLSDIETGQFGLAKAVEAEGFRAQVADQLDSILRMQAIANNCP
ncbi:hypothetical protein [Acidipila sp. EB88]|uniref:hypothetical protein n=1 Tax=Acidipila sp. EB88 TaxID=2305226 RepID=UPI000F5D9B19|nr:hypothetical protein [Acidipila sp. EB88]RRA50330.1 hypothetical protein D1Y84_01010 [Acidipila sp. EB88]RRA50341.1 hypothetical protein D1Y84_01080 [Acidipila sp. EB88]